MPNSLSLNLASTTTLSLCLGALFAIGCGNAGDGLEDTARNISKRAVHAGSAGAGAEALTDDDASAAAGAPADAMDDASADTNDDGAAYDPTPNGATSADGRKLKDKPAMAVDGPIGDDSVRCGDGKLDDDELCDVGIAAGNVGACPTECEPIDACHAGKLEVHSCWSQCVAGDEIPCG